MSDHSNSNNISTTNSANTGDALRMFMTHVKQMLLSLPPLSTFILIAPFVLYLLDNLLLFMYSQTISQWLYLDIEKVTSNFECNCK